MKKEEAEAPEKAAKDKHQQEWDGEDTDLPKTDLISYTFQ